jgi:hypothetical protein
MPDYAYPNPQIDARTWAISHPDNRYSWTKALLLYKAGLENKLSDYAAYGSTRDALFAAAFRAVGETMHLVADMALPAHVRDDSHPYAEPYEDTVDRWVIREIIGTDCDRPEGPAIPTGVITSNQTPAELIDALAAYTNRTFFSDETISDKATGVLPARTGPDLAQATKAYDSPQISNLTKEGNTYYATIMGKRIPLAQDSLLGVTLGNLVWAAYRSPAALARKQAEILVPLAVTAGSEVINAFFPKVVSEVTVTANKTSGKHTVQATLTFQGTRAWQEAGLAPTYNGPVQILRNGVKELDLEVVRGQGTVEVAGWKADDQVQLLLRTGGLRIESPAVRVPGGDCNFSVGAEQSVTLSVASATCHGTQTFSVCFVPAADGSLVKSSSTESGCGSFLDNFEVSGSYGCNSADLTFSYQSSDPTTYPGCSSSTSVVDNVGLAGRIGISWTAATRTYSVTQSSGTYAHQYSSTDCKVTFPAKCTGADLAASSVE